MDRVEGNGFVTITNRLLILLHQLVRRRSFVIALSQIRRHLDDFGENGYSLVEGPALHGPNAILQTGVDLGLPRAMPHTPEGLLSRLSHEGVVITQGLCQCLDRPLIADL